MVLPSGRGTKSYTVYLSADESAMAGLRNDYRIGSDCVKFKAEAIEQACCVSMLVASSDKFVLGREV